MTEFRTDKAIIRIHGQAEREATEQATIRYLKEVRKRKKGKK